MKAKPVVIIIKETALQSWLRDASSVVAFVALIGIGQYLENTTMQVFGGILGMLTLFTGFSGIKGKNTFTIEQARKRLDELEAK